MSAQQLALIDPNRPPSAPRPVDPKTDIELAAEQFVSAEQDLFNLFCRFALSDRENALANGDRPRLSAKGIAERIRALTKREWNNSHTAHVAVLAMKRHPELKDLFKQRGRKP